MFHQSRQSLCSKFPLHQSRNFHCIYVYKLNFVESDLIQSWGNLTELVRRPTQEGGFWDTPCPPFIRLDASLTLRFFLQNSQYSEYLGGFWDTPCPLFIRLDASLTFRFFFQNTWGASRIPLVLHS